MPRRELQNELKKREPFESSEQEAILNLLRTHDLLHNRMGKLFREFGLTPSQYNVLRILRGERIPLPSLEIASRLVQVVPAITGLISRLENNGLVERKRSAADRRVVNVAITAEGLKLLEKIDLPLEHLHESLLGHMTEGELQRLIDLLEKARSCM